MGPIEEVAGLVFMALFILQGLALHLCRRDRNERPWYSFNPRPTAEDFEPPGWLLQRIVYWGLGLLVLTLLAYAVRGSR